LFIDADVNMIEHAAKLGVDRIEYYTGPFAKEYYINKENAISSIKETVEIAHQLGLGINAGHDLNLDNLKFFKNNVPYLEEVSIGHAIVCDALYFGLENTIKMYLHQINA
jgi:pyridoxine 5-phosphate synthase